MLRALALLLPALIPSWRFFREVAASPRIELRTGRGWREVALCPPRMGLAMALRRLLWNPERAEALYLVSLAERQVAAPSTHSLSELLCRLSRRHAIPVAELQFRLLFVSRDGQRLTRAVLYQSPDPPR